MSQGSTEDLATQEPLALPSQVRQAVLQRFQAPRALQSQDPLALRSQGPLELQSQDPLALQSQDPLALRSQGPLELPSQDPLALLLQARRARPANQGSTEELGALAPQALKGLPETWLTPCRLKETCGCISGRW